MSNEEAVYDFANTPLGSLTYYYINGQKYYRQEDIEWYLQNTAFREWKKKNENKST